MDEHEVSGVPDEQTRGLLVHVRHNYIFQRLHRITGTERCGLIVGNRQEGQIEVVRLIETPNRHPEPQNHFRITRSHALQAAGKSALTSLGYWHTHVQGHEDGPSQWDMEQMARYPHLIGMVYHVPTGIVSWFNNIEIIKKEYQ